MLKELSINSKKINFSGSIALGGTSSAGKKEFSNTTGIFTDAEVLRSEDTKVETQGNNVTIYYEGHP